MPKRTIKELLDLGVPVARIASDAGLSRRDVYAFMDPAKYRHLAIGKLERIASFEGRKLGAVAEEYARRVKSAA